MIRGKYVLTYVNVFILFLMQTILLLSQTIYIHDPEPIKRLLGLPIVYVMLKYTNHDICKFST